MFFFSYIFSFLALVSLGKPQGEKALGVTKPVFLPLPPPLSGHVPRRRRFTPVRLIVLCGTFNKRSRLRLDLSFPITLHTCLGLSSSHFQQHRRPYPILRLRLSLSKKGAYRHKLITFRLLHPGADKKSPGVCRGARLCAPLRFSFFTKKTLHLVR